MKKRLRIVTGGLKFTALLPLLLGLSWLQAPVVALGMDGTEGPRAGLDLAHPWVGRPAPPLLLSTVDEGHLVASDTLFDFSSATLLAFWTTHCAECVRRLEICQELYDWGEGDGLNVIGINFDEHPSSKIRLLAHSVTPRLTQLYDAGGRAAAAYGAGAHSFSVFLVDYEGTVRGVGYEIPADSLAQLRPHLSRLMEESFGEEDSAGDPDAESTQRQVGLLAELGLLRQQRFTVEGVGRLRWMKIDTTGVGATGPNGEQIEPGSFFHHRMELQLIYAINRRLTAGALLWLSNEGEAVLRSGPNYLTSPWGSAFVRYDTQGQIPALGRFETSLRAGYYDAWFTPLTLMRWDKDDSPVSGGQKVQGCGVCGGEAGLAGFIRSESLEALAPEYTLEGGRWDVSLADRLDLTALYARPQRHWPAEGWDCFGVDDALMRYHQELYGGRLTGHISVPWGADLLGLSTTALVIQDNEENWPCAARPDYDAGKDLLLGTDLALPLPWRMALTAEYARSRWTPELDEEDDSRDEESIWAYAARGAWDIDVRPFGGRRPESLATLADLSGGPTARINIGYQHIGENFYSPYSALSYESNLRLQEGTSLPGLKGARGSVRIEWGPFGLGGFVKKLTPVDEAALPGDETPGGKRQMASLWFDVLAWDGGTWMAGLVWDDRDPLKNQTLLEREERRTVVVSVEQELARECILMLEAQFLDGKRGETDPGEYTSRTIRCMMDVEF